MPCCSARSPYPTDGRIQTSAGLHKRDLLSHRTQISHLKSRLTPDEVARRLSWAGIYQKDGWLAFRDEPLSKVVVEFNRHNKRQLKIGDPKTGRLQVGGKFRVTDVDGFVAALGITHGVKATHSGPEGRADDVIILTGGSSESEGSDEIVDPPLFDEVPKNPDSDIGK
jgi:ferric-dicitrate binding protein FerR (iron transport regulator)